MITIDTERVYSLRPNEYDAGVLEMISASHPEIPDVAGLIRKALREYEKAREGGGMMVKAEESLTIVKQLAARVENVENGVNFLVARAEKCESVGD